MPELSEEEDDALSPEEDDALSPKEEDALHWDPAIASNRTRA